MVKAIVQKKKTDNKLCFEVVLAIIHVKELRLTRLLEELISLNEI